MQFRIGDVIHITKENLLSQAIQFVSGGASSHVGIIYKEGEDEYAQIFEMANIGKIRSMQKYLFNEKIKIRNFRHAKLTQKDQAVIQENCLLFTGRHYSYWDIFRQFFRWDWFAKRLNSSKFMICSEAVGKIYAKINKPFKKHYEAITPADMLKEQEKYKKWVEVIDSPQE